MMTAEEKRELYMKAYNEHKYEVDARIADGIEKNRKGWCKVRLTDRNGKPVSGKKIKLTQKTHDFKYGANIFMLDEFKNDADNAEYRRFFKEHFNLATVPFYWDGLEPTEGKPRYAKDSEKVYRRPAPELCMEYCAENGIAPKLHCLVYDKFVPDWLVKLPLQEIKKKYEERFRQIAERFSGRMLEFEVINELLCECRWNYKTALSEERDIVEWAFNTARKYFPNETLVINECNTIQDLAYTDYRHPYFMMIENALLKGVSIDKIGLQNHLFTGATAHTPEEYESSVRKGVPKNDPMLYFKGLDIIAELGLPLEITEITVPTFGDTPEDEELQADMLKLWYSVWFSHPAVNTVVYWNTVDGYAYTSDSNWVENNCRGGLWHHDLTPKKSAVMLKKLFSEIWHTDLELTTDTNGYVEFRGFFGDYTAEAEGREFEIALHKNESCSFELTL
ncbi:MAG: endo-1,4-beta-xylanase [Oscillospiraceae bacterium]|nr:endo-1,4-beta-xylanase [Oscillospiraceae bacterium]